MTELDNYKKAIKQMAIDYIEHMRENADWGEYLYPAGESLEWVWYKYPLTDEVINMFLSDYLLETKNFFYGSPPKETVGDMNSQFLQKASLEGNDAEKMS
jgi:hypothetical protein